MGGIASKLMRASMAAMEETFDAEYVSLHVRYTNRAAFTLYSQTLGFEINDIEKGYYADKEDAYDMRKMFAKGVAKQEAERLKKKKVERPLAVKDGDDEASKKPAEEAKEEKKDDKKEEKKEEAEAKEDGEAGGDAE